MSWYFELLNHWCISCSISSNYPAGHMCFKNLWMKKINIHKGFCPSLNLLQCPLSSFPLVYAFANLLMRCVVTMVSNVSDSSDAWPGMLLHAHMLQHSLMPLRAGHTHTCTRTHTHTYTQRHFESFALSKRVCMHICVHVLYTKSMHARVQSGVCQDETAVASCMRRETSCCLAANRGRSAKISTNQICWGRMQEVSLTASRRKTQKHYEATR